MWVMSGGFFNVNKIYESWLLESLRGE
jgi:hypothetical protein